MSFTHEERKAWLAEKPDGQSEADSPETPICDHCKNPFYRGQGVVTDGFALCDVCNGD